ncbi:MAG: nucleotidyltransferase domain-containing protein [Candidatus Bathyarchaeota archaeon]|nr:nucleotidyltransferase domain-containing protein [Candidatus Bathyarchaeota archaeon]
MSFDPDLKQKIAKEAATLLYLGIEKEYKQAKVKAAKTFRSRILPSNREIAIELDMISEEREGVGRKKNLVKMRIIALEIMKTLRVFNPLLIGSVWRGTIHHSSDIDILVYHDRPMEILTILKKQGFQILKTKRVTVTKKGKPKKSYHIYLKNLNKQIIEITIRNLDQQSKMKKCEIFGDKITGLKVKDLEKILKETPTEKFIPI